jgi:hypothetical protein
MATTASGPAAGTAPVAPPGPSSNTQSSQTMNSLGNFSTPNFHFISLIGPYTLIGFFALHSIFNTNIKGIIYVIGVLVLCMLSKLVGVTYISGDDTVKVCNLIGPQSFFDKGVPFGTLVYTFTFMYLFIPMLIMSMMNYPLLMTLMLMIGVDTTIQLNMECTQPPMLLLSVIIAMIWGGIYSYIISLISPDMLYHTDYLSDKQVCSMPSEQKFKCKVYRNGELITTMTK